MGKRAGDKYINFQVSEQEDRLLKRYCELTHRSQTEVMRELVRGLEDAIYQLDQDNQVQYQDKGDKYVLRLPAGFRSIDFESIEGEYEGQHVGLYQEAGGWQIFIEGEKEIFVNGYHPGNAIGEAQRIIDSRLLNLTL